MCKIKVRQSTQRNASIIRGFTRHFWFFSKRAHRIRQQKPRPKCEICGQSFSCIGNLNRHKKLHSEYDRLKCNLCQRTYSTFSNFKIHISRHHPNTDTSNITFTTTTEGAKKRPIFTK